MTVQKIGSHRPWYYMAVYITSYNVLFRVDKKR